MAVFHYIPLHGCPAGEHFGEFHGEDRYTTKESERLLRLPLFYNLSPVNQRTVIRAANRRAAGSSSRDPSNSSQSPASHKTPLSHRNRAMADWG